jgi:hypothetical protein
MAAAKISSIATASVINLTSNDKYVLYDLPEVEPPIENEEGFQRELHEIISRVQRRNLAKHGHGYRGTHVKTQAIVKGTFTVLPDLAPELAQGICSPENASREHDVAIRFANEPSFLQDDREPGPRGLGMTVFDVEGKYLTAEGEKTHRQDLTFNNAPLLELRDVSTAVEIFKIREAHFDHPEEIGEIIKKRPDAKLQMAPSQLPNQHFLSYTMYSQSAYRWGDYVCKYQLVPSSISQSSLASTKKISSTSDPGQHRKWLSKYFAENDAEYDFRVQLLQSVKNQSVEDTGMLWDEMAFPFQTVAKVKLPKGQDSFDEARVKFWEDSMKLNVWYGLETMRPLGSVNRLRKNLYKVSSTNRKDMNGIELVYISSINQIP